MSVSASKTFMKNKYQMEENKMGSPKAQRHDYQKEEIEICSLKRDIKLLQNAFTVCLDQNESLKQEVQLLECTLDMARIAIQEKDQTIQNLKQFISNSIETQREPKVTKNKQKYHRNSSI